jgi:hypothetical protein
MTIKPWMIGDPGSAFDQACVFGAFTAQPRGCRLKSNLFSRNTASQQKAIGTGGGVAAGTCVRPDSTFAAEIHAQIAGIDSDDAKNGV